MVQVTSPVKGYSGVVAGVRFEDGTADVDATEQESALAYFQRQGYKVDGGDDFQLEDDASPYLPDPGGAIGQVVENPKGPLDAADPDNELVPVGGVKSAASPGSPTGRKGRRARTDQGQPADITPSVPVAAQDNIQSAESATPATTPSAAPVGDDTAPDASVATPAPDPALPPVTANTVKDAAVQEEKDTTSDAAAPDDAKSGDQSPTGADAAGDNLAAKSAGKSTASTDTTTKGA